MGIVGILGNLVAAVAVAWCVDDAVVALVSAARIGNHQLRWWRRSLVSLPLVAFGVGISALYGLLRPALLAAGAWLLAWAVSGFGVWLRSAWGVWAGAALGLAHGAYVAARARSDDMERVFMSIAYDTLHEQLPERLSVRQQTFVDEYRRAHEERQRIEEQGGPSEDGSAEPAEWPSLPFRIEEVRTGQGVTGAPPYFAPGGDWTVLKCSLTAGKPATFFLAERSGVAKGEPPFAWGEGRLWVTATAAADALLAACRSAFPPEEVDPFDDESLDSGSDPSRDPGPALAPAAPLECRTAVMGRRLAKTENGFSGRGTWTASKWFFGEGDELFVNYSVAEKRGELAEKDEVYRLGILEAMAGLADRQPRG